MSFVPSTKLNSGYDMPLIGYGTFGGRDAPSKVYEAAKQALEYGYRCFDTASLYRTEEALGKAIAESDVDRKDIFVITKLWNNFHEAKHVRTAFNDSLRALQLDYIDLFLMHWHLSFEYKGDGVLTDDENMKPTDVPITETWHAMEQLVKDGVARSIGVSNFTIPMLQDILDNCEIPPAVHQIEIHPNLDQQDMIDFCVSKNITLIAYSPLGNPGFRQELKIKIMDEPVVKEIATKYNKTVVQVLLNWGINRGYSVIPKSVTPSRMKENLVYFEMDQKDIDAITEIGRKSPIRTCSPLGFWGEFCDVFGEKNS